MNLEVHNIENFTLDQFQTEVQKIHVIGVLQSVNYNFASGAKKMDIQRSHLYNLVKKYKIYRPGTETVGTRESAG